MKHFEEFNEQEKDQIIMYMSNWLKNYTEAVIMKVMEKKEQIINDGLAMHLMTELYIREEKERKDFTYSIEMLFRNFDTFKKYDPHNNPLQHSQSYRDVLYDMYIKEV